MYSYDLKWCLNKALITPNRSCLIVTEVLSNSSALCRGIVSGMSQFEGVGLVEKARKHPMTGILFSNGFRLDFRHGQYQGDSLRGMRPKNFVAAESALSSKAMPELIRASSDPVCEEVCFSFPKMASFEWGFIVATAAVRDLAEMMLKGRPEDAR